MLAILVTWGLYIIMYTVTVVKSDSSASLVICLSSEGFRSLAMKNRLRPSA
jgi:hypothetical protein